MSFANMKMGVKFRFGLALIAVAVAVVVWSLSKPKKGPQKALVASCDALRISGEKSGVYEIDPDGDEGSISPIKTKCEMVPDGAWTLVVSISDKYGDHASDLAVNEQDFFMDGEFGKLSDGDIRTVAKRQEFRLQCGSGEIREVFIKNHVWRSNVNAVGYDGQYSLDGKQWFPFHERGAGPWKGFDNYAVTYESGANPKAAFAYNIGGAGCFSMSDGGKPAKGFLWAR